MKQKTNIEGLPAFRRVFVIFNPASTRANVSLKRIAELKQLYPGIVKVIDTSPDGLEANRAIIRKLAPKLDHQTLIAVAAGDGTVNMVVEALAATGEHELPERARRAVLFPMWGGNANDLAVMLNGAPPRKLAAVLRHARILPVYPLLVQIITHDQVRSHYAACYVSFGASGYTAHKLNDRTYRGHPLYQKFGVHRIRELLYVTRILSRVRRIEVRAEGRRRKLYEMLIANGPRMAKVAVWPVKLHEQAYYVDTLAHRKLLTILGKAWAMLRGRSQGKRRTTELRLTMLSDVWAQVDGEPEQLPAGARVRIGIHKHPISTLARNVPKD